MATKTSPNALLLYNKFLELGIAPGTAAGAVGSMMGESGAGLNTAALNRGDGSDGSDSIGAGQWNQGRAMALKRTANEMKLPWTDIRAQVAHVGNELTGSHNHVLKALLNAGDDVRAGNDIWTRQYEIPANAGAEARNRLGGGLSFARQVGAMSPEQISAITAQAPAAPAEPRQSAGRGGASPTIREMTSAGNFGLPSDPLGGMIALGGFGSSDAAKPVAQLASADPRQADALAVRAISGVTTVPGAPIQAAQSAPIQMAEASTTTPGGNPYAGLATPVVQAAPVQAEASNPYAGVATPAIVTGQSGATPSATAQYRFNDTAEAPASLRFEVDALNKPEDQLAALRRHYPTAMPYDGDNFVYQNAEGEWQKYNNKGWVPSWSDVAGAAPSIVEAIGGGLGALGGGVLGAAAAGVGAVPGAMAGAAAGGLGAREAAQRGINWYYGNQDTRSTGEQLTDAAITAGANAVGEGAGRLVAKGIGAAGRGLGFGTQATEAAANDMRAIGIEPTVGMVTGNAPTQYLERATAAVPIAGSRTAAAGRQAAEAMSAENDRIIQGIASRTNPNATPGTPQEVGAALKGAAGEAQDRFRQVSDANYGAVGALTGDAPVIGTAMGALGADLSSEVASLSAFGRRTYGTQLNDAVGMVQALNEDIANGATFDTMKQARTQVGGMLADATNKAEKGYLGRIYDTLTAEMGGAADAAGGGARAAWEGADAAYKAGVAKGSPVNVKENLAPVLTAKVDEDVLTNMLKGVEKGGSRIAAARRQIVQGQGNEAWDAFQAAAVERLGTTTDGFSASKFLKGWEAMKPEAKAALFDGTANEAYRADLDRLARIAGQMKRYGSTANHSNTANVGAMQSALKGVGLLGGAFVAGKYATAGLAAGTAVGTAAATKGLDLLLTSPTVVRLVANLPRAQVQRGGVQRTVEGLLEYATAPGLEAGFRQSVTELARSIEESQSKTKKK
ncbi:phage tail tip lysozyme [Methylorubrum thiocyanatum]|uniref:phage tail tip lysozyme n=1 Tax=Methylorubrum thiocyanatum TaxID=47958 RepID=UPI003F7D27F0